MAVIYTSMAALIFLWPVPGTIAARNLLLLTLLAATLAHNAGEHFLALRQALARARWQLLLLGLLTVWLYLHTATMSAYPEYSYSELAGQWDKSILIFIVGMLVASTLGRERKAASLAFTLIAATLALQMTVVVADFFYLWNTGGLPPFGEARLTGSRTGTSYVANLFMAIVLSNMIARGLASGAFLRTTVAAEIGGLALAMVCLIMAGARNGIFTAIMLIVIAFVFYVVSRRREMSGITRQTVAIAVISAIAAIALVYGSLKTDKRWNVFLETARIALMQAERPNWIYLETMGLPELPDGGPVEESAYARLARYRAGLRFIAENPLGWGFGRGAFERAIELRYGVKRVASDSGLIDWAIGTGVVGVILLIAFVAGLFFIGLKVFLRNASFPPLVLMFVSIGFLSRSVIDINTRDNMLETFMFFGGLSLLLAQWPSHTHE